MTKDAVLKPETAIYRYLDVLGAGSELTIYTSGPHKGRTNRLAVLTKEPGAWGDWHPKGELRVEIKSFDDGAISSNSVSDLLTGNPQLWASVDEK